MEINLNASFKVAFSHVKGLKCIWKTDAYMNNAILNYYNKQALSSNDAASYKYGPAGVVGPATSCKFTYAFLHLMIFL